MTNWNFKHMDRLAMVGRRLAQDRNLDATHRAGFAAVHALAETLKLANPNTHKAHVARTFTLLCAACQQRRMYPCPGGESEQQFCRLVRDHSSS